MKVKVKEKKTSEHLEVKKKGIGGMWNTCERTELSGQKYWRHKELLKETGRKTYQFAVGSLFHLPKWGFDPNDRDKTKYYSVTAESELF